MVHHRRFYEPGTMFTLILIQGFLPLQPQISLVASAVSLHCFYTLSTICLLFIWSSAYTYCNIISITSYKVSIVVNYVWLAGWTNL